MLELHSEDSRKETTSRALLFSGLACLLRIFWSLTNIAVCMKVVVVNKGSYLVLNLYFGHLNSFKKVHEKDPADPRLAKATPLFRRSLFTVGLLLRHFDFTQEDLYTGLEVS